MSPILLLLPESDLQRVGMITKMAKPTGANKEAVTAEEQHSQQRSPEIDSKYRMIIIAAQRSKQLQRGARPRVEIAHDQHKHARVALTEVEQRKIDFTISDEKAT